MNVIVIIFNVRMMNFVGLKFVVFSTDDPNQFE